MLIYRICRAEFATNLNASGFAGRWNQEGQKVLYASATRSLAALEQLANRSGLVLSASYRVMVIDVPNHSHSLGAILPDQLPSDWRRFSGYGRLQEIGANWYRRSESLLLPVPSVMIPQEFNYLIHTQHPDFSSHVRFVGMEDFDWDKRFGMIDG